MAKRTTTRRARKPRVNKMQQMRDHFKQHPDAAPKDVAKMFHAPDTTAYKARRDVRLSNGDEETTELYDAAAMTKDIRVLQRIGIPQVKKLVALIETINGG